VQDNPATNAAFDRILSAATTNGVARWMIGISKETVIVCSPAGNPARPRPGDYLKDDNLLRVQDLRSH
jgi:hypothetical protein